MPYTLNPHRHVKIWLSSNPDVFLNQENQLRLVNMRGTNPVDSIQLIYAKRLLSEQAFVDLTAFCEKHHIIPVSIEDEIIPECLRGESETEKRLIGLSEQEIAAINHGGNLAAASDILRWLKPVFSRGIYSDMDVTPKTKGLPEEITVEAPVIMNIGSISIPISGLPLSNKLESLALNNDIIAVVGDDQRAQQIIQKVQQYILGAYENPAIYSEFYERFGIDINQYVTQQMGAIVGATTAAQVLQRDPKAIITDELLTIAFLLADRNPIYLRKKLFDNSKSDDAEMKHCRSQLRKIDFSAEERTDKQAQAFYAGYLRRVLPTSIAIGKTDAELITFEKEARDNMHLQITVMNTTGPSAVMLGMFGHAALPAGKIDAEIKPYTFECYRLETAFSSINSVGKLHSKNDEHLEKAQGKIGSAGDQSWTIPGIQAVAKREGFMHDASTKISATYRGHMVRVKKGGGVTEPSMHAR